MKISWMLVTYFCTSMGCPVLDGYTTRGESETPQACEAKGREWVKEDDERRYICLELTLTEKD